MKHVKIWELKHAANSYFIHSDDKHAAGRETLHHFVSSLLHEHKAYAGFRYLAQSDVGQGKTPGIVWGANGDANTFPDPTRIAFY